MGMRHGDVPRELNELTERVIGAAIEVHRGLGPGYLERIYEAAFCHELSLRGIRFCRQVELVVQYKGLDIGGQRADLVVEESLLVELKAVESVSDVHLAQLVSYLHAGRFPYGLLLNFHVPVMHKGVYRRINPLVLSATSASPRSDPAGGGPI